MSVAARTAEQGEERVVAVLLAAGESSRMGGLDKRLVEIDGEPLVARWLRLLPAAGVPDVVVVLGHDAARIGPLVSREQGGAVRVRTVINASWAEGQQGSVLAGLAALRPGESAMIVLCDLALLDADDLRALVDAFERRPHGTEVLVPVHGGRRGNPVIASSAAVAEVVSDPARAGLRAWLDRDPSRVHRFETANDHPCVDLDTPDDIARLERRLGRPVRRVERSPGG